MTREPLDPRRTRELAGLIRQSAVLDPTLKRQWLRVLPYLKPSDLARLEAILSGEVCEEADERRADAT